MRQLNLLVIAAFLTIASAVHAQQIKPFKAGDRVTFVGNSITDGGQYHSYIWLYYMTHFPNQRVWMANLGIGGDTSEDILRRFDGDVLSKNPTVLTLTFGMNDTGYGYNDAKDKKAYGDSTVQRAQGFFNQIVNKIKNRRDLRIVMIGTSPYDETSTLNDNPLKGKNAVMQQIIGLQKQAAQQYGWEFLDFNQPMLDINKEQQAKDPKFTICGNDRVHPDNDGHMVMAYLFLKGQGMIGKDIANVNIDASQGKVLQSDNCKITDLKNDGRAISFDYLANSLPYPLDTIARGWGFKRPQRDVVKLIPSFMKDLDNEQLKVSGLQGDYMLSIDGEQIGIFSAQQLAQGINLATYHTPQYQQALAVMALNEERWERERRFRDFAWVQFDYFLKNGITDIESAAAAERYQKDIPTNLWLGVQKDIFSKMRLPAVRAAFQKEIDILVDKIYEINKPKNRHFLITPCN